MVFAAVSSKTVLTKFEPNRLENSGTCVPLGATRTAVSPASDVAPMLSETLRFWIWSVPPELTVTVEERVPGPAMVGAGIAWSTPVELKTSWPEIVPSGPVIDMTWLAVKVLVWIGRSKVTWNWLVVSLVSRSVDPVDCCPEVPTASVEAICGPGTIRGSVFWLNGGLRMLSAVVKVTGAASWGVGTA